MDIEFEASAQEKIFTSSLLRLMVKQTSHELGVFSSWLMAGAAAFFGLLLNALDKVHAVISLAAVPVAMKLFLAAVCLHVLQKGLGALVSGGVNAGEGAEQLTRDLPNGGATLRLGVVTALIEKAFLPPARWLVARANRRVNAGDIMGAPSLLVRLTQVQWLLVIVQIGMLLIAGWKRFP